MLQPTFYRGNTQSVLDVVLLSRELCSVNVPYACTIETCHFVSHHRRVTVALSVPRVRPVPLYRTRRNWRAFDDQAFLADIHNTDW